MTPEILTPAQVREVANKAIALIARGKVEGAYENIAAGPDYADRIIAGLERIADGKVSGND